MIEIPKIIGALGLVLIIIGLLVKDRKTRNIYYLIGGCSLIYYSFRVGDLIFIILQIAFTLATIYDFIKLQKNH